ncbi:sulfite exporter TauE/SafE family protein [Flavobacteriaceae bacterium D16]|nr:sulfite exporter TauE/SafE family protein [Flavobacteriaceae bacterium D16]
MLLSALVLGLMGSLHCVGMCGPIAFMLPVDHKKPIKKLGQVTIYHLGRMLAYGIIGLLFGFIGKGLYLFGVQQKLSIAIGVIMIILVLLPYKYLSGLSLARPVYSLVGKIKGWLGESLKSKSPDTFLTIGFLNGFLPCGLVYMALLGAIASGDPAAGALYMMVFGLGTIPLMTATVYFGSMLKGSLRQRIKKIIPVFIVIIGVLFILRGMGLGIPYISPKPSMNMVSTEMECHTP